MTDGGHAMVNFVLKAPGDLVVAILSVCYAFVVLGTLIYHPRRNYSQVSGRL